MTTTPYHPTCNGLTEKIYGTLKRMRQRHRYINPLLFAYREISQELAGFASFKLMYGLSISGQKNQKNRTERQVSNTVLDLSERLEETFKLAQEELRPSQKYISSITIGEQRIGNS